MRTPFIILAAGSVLLACSSDNNATGPDPRNCTKGAIGSQDVKTGKLGASSCLRYDYWYSNDSVYYDSWDLALEQGKAYQFNLQGNPITNGWDGTLELVSKDPNTGDDELLAISDDEGPGLFSQLYFIAPQSGTFSMRVSGFDKPDTASYTLTSRACTLPLAPITDTLGTTNQTLEATDCVVEEPQFSGDSSRVKLYAITLPPDLGNGKTILVTSSAFFPGIQVYGPGYGTFCYYDYQGCGGGFVSSGGGGVIFPAGGSVRNGALPGGAGNFVQISLFADGAFGCNIYDFCGYNNFPGQYTLAVGGSNYTDLGAFTLEVSAVTQSDVASRQGIPPFNPSLDHLRRKPVAIRPNVRRSGTTQH
jgi:hypothetical protein